MCPGSGAADRHNGSYFAPIREHLLERGCAICSFDKRGVGSSSGHWQDADIPAQSEDVLAVVAAALTELPTTTPVGLFGHSQGGWVVLEAASRVAFFSFVITNSGPGVSPGQQMRYAAPTELAAAGATEPEISQAMEHFDAALSLMRDDVPFEPACGRLQRANASSNALTALARVLPADPDEWRFASAVVDYDPRPAMSAVRVPLLAVFGGDDNLVPVPESVRALRESVRHDVLTVKVFAGSDHRIHTTGTDNLANGYLHALATFVTSASA
jgi:pimeloyl-ACP methyl ester carboxylesterase